MKRDEDLEAAIVEKYAAMSPLLDERMRRQWAGAESRAIGYGGDALVSSATGLARQTVKKGRLELEAEIELHGRVRRPGAGRPGFEVTQPGLTEALKKLKVLVHDFPDDAVGKDIPYGVFDLARNEA